MRLGVARLFRRRFSARSCATLLLVAASFVLPQAQRILLAQSDVTPPAVSLLSPPNSAVNVTADVRVTASFTEAVQPATIAFSLRDSSNTIVPANVSYDASTLTATLTPSSALTALTTFTATVSGVKDLAGNVMAAPAVWSFSTGSTG